MTGFSQDDLKRARDRIAAARLTLIEKHTPYYEVALQHVTVVVDMENTGVFSVSNKWVLKYSPDVPLKYSIEELSAWFLHCFEHVMRKHGERFDNLVENPTPQARQLWEILTDRIINADIEKRGMVLPEPLREKHVTPELDDIIASTKGAKRVEGSGVSGISSEVFFSRVVDNIIAKKMFEVAPDGVGEPIDGDVTGEKTSEDATKPTGEGSDSTDNSDKGDPTDPNADGSTPRDSTDPSKSEGNPREGESGSAGESDESGGSNDSEESSDSEDSSAGDSAGDGDSSDGSEPGDSDSSEGGEESPGEESSPGDSAGDGDSGPSDGNKPEQPNNSSETLDPNASNSKAGDKGDKDGKESGGNPQPTQPQAPQTSSTPITDFNQKMETLIGEPPHQCLREVNPQEDENLGIPNETREELIELTIEEMKNTKKWGKTPGSMARKIEASLKPVISFEKIIAKKLRQRIGKKFGRVDYSYARRNGRQPHSNVVLPALVGPESANIFVIIDTSGSMSKNDLNRALSEIQKLMKRHRGKLYIVAVDANATEVQEIRRTEKIQLIGGGGTDLRVGVDKIVEHKEKADVVLYLTDGGTPWYKTVPPKLRQTAHIGVIIYPPTQKGANYLHNIPAYIDTIAVPNTQTPKKFKLP